MRTIEARLKTTMDQLEALHEARDKTRATSATVKVDRTALGNILMDHAMMVGEIEGRQQ